MHMRARAGLAASLAALGATVLGALWLIAPVWQPGTAVRREAFVPPAATQAPAAAAPLDINTADAQALTALPGVGEVRARAIIAYRAENGPFATLRDAAAVDGISPDMTESWQGLAVAGAGS